MSPARPLDAFDRELILATQEGLPLVPYPYAQVAERLGVAEAHVLTRLRELHQAGVVRRVAAVPNHYRIGFVHNAMTVWDVPDDRIQDAGRRVAALDAVSHCYHRPRRLPLWRYNMFAMVHGRDESELSRHIEQVRDALGPDASASDVLRSRRILKKTGLRLRAAAAS